MGCERRTLDAVDGVHVAVEVLGQPETGLALSSGKKFQKGNTHHFGNYRLTVRTIKAQLPSRVPLSNSIVVPLNNPFKNIIQHTKHTNHHNT
jgi:hypothetical protein